MDFGVCLVQMPCVESDRETNFKRVRWLLKDYTPNTEREFIVLPELFAIGFRHADYENVGAGIPGPTQSFMEELASEKGAYVVATDIERHEEKYFNTLIVTSPKGKTVATYRKIHPFQEERDVFEQGDTLALLDAGGIKVGLEICYDLRFPEVTRGLALEGAELILIPAAFPDPRSHHWNALLLGRAIENQVYIAATNRIGSGFDGKTYFGHSQFIDPWGVRPTRPNSEERVIRERGNTVAVASVRQEITCFQDRNQSAYERTQWYIDV
ncbi:MAG: hypothetical protein K9W43_06160 [Candidatus Thorarchaeota archaeon]|nr:hypothetical protein [Candidatus Thorarchaeota archaeon]